jgi:mono/diheme cytochrome c family protein
MESVHWIVCELVEGSREMKKLRIQLVALLIGMVTISCQALPGFVVSAPERAVEIIPTIEEKQPTATAEEIIAVSGEEVDCTQSGFSFSQLMERGEKIYDRNCRGCHGMTGEGTPDGFFPGLKGSGITQNPNFEVPFVYLMTTDIHPVASSLFEKDTAAILTFIRNAFGNEAPLVCPEEIVLRLFP